jgi:class 3 adenylate cyclase
MKAIVESHEGSVEKFIGDAVMAVFGVPPSALFRSLYQLLLR